MYNLGLSLILTRTPQVELIIFIEKEHTSVLIKICCLRGGFNLPLTNINESDDRGLELSAVFQQNIGKFRTELAPNFGLEKKSLYRNDLEKFSDPDY